MFGYFSALSVGKTILWCYLIWYLAVVSSYFDPAPRIWINSVGISLIIGIALILSVNSSGSWRRDKWQTFRLFLMPFAVSSFSALIKDKAFFLIFPPTLDEIALNAALCLGFLVFVLTIKKWPKR